jgi:hypothetical protein
MLLLNEIIKIFYGWGLFSSLNISGDLESGKAWAAEQQPGRGPQRTVMLLQAVNSAQTDQGSLKIYLILVIQKIDKKWSTRDQCRF